MDDFNFNFQDNFDAEATDYAAGNGFCLANAATLAYEGRDTIEKYAKQWGFPKFRFFDDIKDKAHPNGSDTQAFLMASESTIILSFRGTESKKDALVDANIKHVKGPVGRVHKGFHTALHSVWEDIAKTIWEWRHDNQVNLADLIKKGGSIGSGKAETLWVTGHSLGAALATLATSELVLDMDRPVRGLYTFGCPRAGNKEFARAFNQEFKERAFRYVNNNDLVTRIPPRALGYAHVGNMNYFTTEGDLERKASRWDLFLDRVQGRLEDFREIFHGDFKTDGVEDHSMTNYLANATKALQG